MASRAAGDDHLQLLTPRQVAARFQLRERTVVVGSLRHELAWIKIGNRLRLDPAELERFLSERGDV
jgi:hypothetical protein